MNKDMVMLARLMQASSLRRLSWREDATVCLMARLQIAIALALNVA